MFLLFSSLSLFWTFNYLSCHDEYVLLLNFRNVWRIIELICDVLSVSVFLKRGLRLISNQPERSPPPGPGPSAPSPGFLSLILGLTFQTLWNLACLSGAVCFEGLWTPVYVVLVFLGCWHFNSDFQGFCRCLLLCILDPLLQFWLWWGGWEWGLPVQLYWTVLPFNILNTQAILLPIITYCISSIFSNSFRLTRQEGCLKFSTSSGIGNPNAFSLRKNVLDLSLYSWCLLQFLTHEDAQYFLPN